LVKISRRCSAKLVKISREYSIEKFEGTKGVIRSRDNTMAKGKRTKGQTTIYKTYT
jgi:hypothetical protein